MVRPLPGHLALKDFNARKAVAGAPSQHRSRPQHQLTVPLPAANELLRRAYLFIVRNETIDPKVRSAAMLKLNAFPRAVRTSSGVPGIGQRARADAGAPRSRRPDRRRSRTGARRRDEVEESFPSLGSAGYVHLACRTGLCGIGPDLERRQLTAHLAPFAASVQARRDRWRHPGSFKSILVKIRGAWAPWWAQSCAAV
jgi:hypothetical protein